MKNKPDQKNQANLLKTKNVIQEEQKGLYKSTNSSPYNPTLTCTNWEPTKLNYTQGRV